VYSGKIAVPPGGGGIREGTNITTVYSKYTYVYDQAKKELEPLLLRFLVDHLYSAIKKTS
jgi:hypothetical protein